MTTAVQPWTERLEEVATLPADWDSYWSPPTNPAAVEAARRLIPQVGAEPYDVAPIPGGGVGVEWRDQANDTALEVWITPEGDFGYLRVDGLTSIRRAEEADDVDESCIVEMAREIAKAQEGYP